MKNRILLVPVTIAVLGVASLGFPGTSAWAASAQSVVPALVSPQSVQSAATHPLGQSQVAVTGQSDIYAAGRKAVPNFTNGGGELPPFIKVSARQVLRFLVSGGVSCGGGIPYNGADGPCSIGVASTNVDYYKGISRSLDDQSSFYLEGVFLTYRKPSRPAPSPLDFSKGVLGQDFHSLSPSIGQVVFIGDGVADTGPGAAGYRQAFHVPPERRDCSWASRMRWTGWGRLASTMTIPVSSP
jgi:hypothetical protein